MILPRKGAYQCVKVQKRQEKAAKAADPVFRANIPVLTPFDGDIA
jgi:hypothetical protein